MGKINPEKAAVVIGASAGGTDVLASVLAMLPETFPVPVAAVLHISPDAENYVVDYLDNICHIHVKEAEDKEMLQPGVAYFAPPDYHLQIEFGGMLSLSADERVNFSRPSIDVLFESAADAYRSNLVGIILTGGNRDGSLGLKRISTLGGVTVVQSPDSAYAKEMPRFAVSAAPASYLLDPAAIGMFLLNIFK